MLTDPSLDRVSRETSLLENKEGVAARLDLFKELLLNWNRRINLISRSDEAHLKARHIDDSIQLATLLPDSISCAIDFGSGAGFPGLIISIVTGCHFFLIESDGRKAAFLREAIRVTGANAEICQERVEHISLPPVKLVTARAVAPLIRQIELAHPLLLPTGICIFPKGKTAATELTDARQQWHMRADQHASRTNPEATIFVLSEIRRVQA